MLYTKVAVSITLFKTLIAVADSGSFAAAAREVYVSHAAVGQQMRRLEAQLQVRLFDRTQKTPILNQLGKSLVPRARSVVDAYDNVLDGLVGDALYIGELNLGAVPSTIRGLIPETIKQLIPGYPDLRIRVIPGLSGALRHKVHSGAIDAAVISEPGESDPLLRWQPFVREELVLLTAPEVTGDDPLQIMSQRPYIRHALHSAVGILAERWLSDNAISVRDAVEMDSLDNICNMVTHNLGVSVVPNLCVPDLAFAGLRKIPLGSEKIYRTLGLLSRVDCSKNHLVDKLRDELANSVTRHKNG